MVVGSLRGYSVEGLLFERYGIEFHDISELNLVFVEIYCLLTYILY